MECEIWWVYKMWEWSDFLLRVSDVKFELPINLVTRCFCHNREHKFCLSIVELTCKSRTTRGNAVIKQSDYCSDYYMACLCRKNIIVMLASCYLKSCFLILIYFSFSLYTECCFPQRIWIQAEHLQRLTETKTESWSVGVCEMLLPIYSEIFFCLKYRTKRFCAVLYVSSISCYAAGQGAVNVSLNPTV